MLEKRERKHFHAWKKERKCLERYQGAFTCTYLIPSHSTWPFGEPSDALHLLIPILAQKFPEAC